MPQRPPPPLGGQGGGAPPPGGPPPLDEPVPHPEELEENGEPEHAVHSFSSDFDDGLIDQDRTQAGRRKGGLNVGGSFSGHAHYGRPIEDQQIRPNQPDRSPNRGDFNAQFALNARGKQSLFEKARERYRQRRNQIEEEMAQRLEHVRNKESKSDVGVSGGKQIENSPGQGQSLPQDDKFEEETAGHEPPTEIAAPQNVEPPKAVQSSPVGPPAPGKYRSV